MTKTGDVETETKTALEKQDKRNPNYAITRLVKENE